MSDPHGLSAEQRAALQDAAARMKIALRPARVARVNGWTVGIFGGLSVLVGLLAGPSGVVVGLALVAIAWNELRGVARLETLDPEGARILGWNQVILGAVVIVYCAYAIWRARVSPDPSLQELEELGSVSASLVAELTSLLYGGVAIIVAIVQALLARYHFRARARVEELIATTPLWVRETLLASAG